MINIALRAEIKKGSCDIVTFFIIFRDFFQSKNVDLSTTFMIISVKKWYLGVSWELGSFVEAVLTH